MTRRRAVALLALSLLVGCSAPAPSSDSLGLTSQTTTQRIAALEREVAALKATDAALQVRLAHLEQPAAPSTPPRPSATPAPTASPTVAPTPAPTVTPTANPAPTPTPKVITVAAGTKGYTAKSNEVIDGWRITCPGDTVYDGSTVGLFIPAGASNVTVRNTTISGCGDACLRIDGATGFNIESDTFTDCAYAGIITTGASKGTIRGNLVQRIGTRGHQRDFNAYGIVLSMWAGGIPSSDILVDGNTVTDVRWHGYDTHGGQRITFVNNAARRTARAYFITANLATERATGTVLTGNLAAEPVSDVAAGGTDANSAFTLYDTRGTQFVGNNISSYSTILNDVGSLSQGLVQSGNVRVAA